MIIKVIPDRWRGVGYKVEAKQGVQTFFFECAGTIEDCRWYAKMFRLALKRHSAEQIKKRSKQ